MDNRPLSEIYAEIAEAWVDADAAASLLEDTRSAYLSQRMLMYGDIAVSKAEASVKATPAWKDYVEKTIAARKRANLLKVQMETIRMRFQEYVSQEANNRTQARL